MHPNLFSFVEEYITISTVKLL